MPQITGKCIKEQESQNGHRVYRSLFADMKQGHRPIFLYQYNNLPCSLIAIHEGGREGDMGPQDSLYEGAF
ncbi:hypothetical protein EUGRSUZ_A01372 [Eucalyptus grandis]|uniref:Uncharacterized protein n=2 Tax=Eucalyptus grandis TaxID=71139 RepID=A0ACC3M036_EUCGR|nr:hypothetical protein EUGRSUZ_A01372 [Eucalyptus grandis]